MYDPDYNHIYTYTPIWIYMVLESLISDQQQPTIVVVYVNNACLHGKRLSWFWKYWIYFQYKHFGTFYHTTDRGSGHNEYI